MRIAPAIYLFSPAWFIPSTLLTDLATSPSAKTQREPGYITSILKVRRDMGHDQADLEMNNETLARNTR